MPLFDFLRKKQPVIDTQAVKPTGAKSFEVTGSFQSLWNQHRLMGARGHHVIPENNSAVVSALRWIMRNTVSAPITVERFINGRWEVIPNHPAELLYHQPNPWMTGRQLSQGICLSLVLDGNAYILKVRNGNGRLAGLQYLPHGHITAIPGFVDGTPVPIAFYEYRAGSKTMQIAPADMIHIKDGVDPNNSALGWSGLKSVVQQILTDDEATQYTFAVLKNLGVSGLIVSPVGDGAVITEDQAERLKNLITEETTGDNRGKPIVSSQAINIETKGFSPEEMAIEKISKIPEARILSVIGINGLCLGLTSGESQKTYSNYGEARSSAFEDYLVPQWQLIDETLTNQLLPEFGLGQTERFDRDFSSVRAFMDDESDLTDRLVNQYINGICMRSEARQALGYATTPEDEVYFLDAQASLISDGTAKNYLKADIVKKLTARNATDRGY